MPRPAGVRNHDFEEKRDALLDLLTDFALKKERCSPSLRQFAIAANTSEPTLRHYFGNRQGVVLAILEHLNKRAQPVWTIVETPAEDAENAIREFFRITRAGLTHGGFAEAYGFGLTEGMADAVVGQAFLRLLLDPALETIAKKLANTPGIDISEDESRVAAFVVLSPILTVTLHQSLLGGREASPIEPNGFLDTLKCLLSTGVRNVETECSGEASKA